MQKLAHSVHSSTKYPRPYHQIKYTQYSSPYAKPTKDPVTSFRQPSLPRIVDRYAGLEDTVQKKAGSPHEEMQHGDPVLEKLIPRLCPVEQRGMVTHHHHFDTPQ